MDTLSALDATFLELEQAEPSAHMHLGAVLVFEPPAGRRPPALEAVCERAEERLRGWPRFGQRLASPTAGGLRLPHWVEDPAFRIEAHIRRAALPAPGSAAELLDWAGDFYSHRLDRSRPLWEAVVIEGLEGGRWALAVKVHHCLVDGAGSIAAGLGLLDGAERVRPPAAAGTHDGSPWTAPVRAVLHPRRTLERAAAIAELLARDELAGAPHTSLNVPIGGRRRLATVGVELEQARAIRRSLGGTVNDVVLACVTAGLRELLLTRGETPPDGGLRAMVPVDLRAGEQDLPRPGNRVSTLFVPLPVDAAEPLERHARIRRATAAHKRGGEAGASGSLLELGRFAPPVLSAVAAQTRLATRLFNVTVTNLPGPAGPLHAFGARLRDAIPIVPLAAEHAVGVAVLSLDGRLVFCLNCDRDAVPDAPVAATAIAAELDRLAAIAGGIDRIHQPRVPGGTR